MLESAHDLKFGLHFSALTASLLFLAYSALVVAVVVRRYSFRCIRSGVVFTVYIAYLVFTAATLTTYNGIVCAWLLVLLQFTVCGFYSQEFCGCHDYSATSYSYGGISLTFDISG